MNPVSQDYWLCAIRLCGGAPSEAHLVRRGVKPEDMVWPDVVGRVSFEHQLVMLESFVLMALQKGPALLEHPAEPLKLCLHLAIGTGGLCRTNPRSFQIQHPSRETHFAAQC